MADIIAAIICFVLSMGSFIISIRSFMEKGYLFNNAYLYATKQERILMNKRPYYRQSAIVFLLMGILFLLTAVLALFYTKWIFYIVMALAAIMVMYAVGSSIAIERKKYNYGGGEPKDTGKPPNNRLWEGLWKMICSQSETPSRQIMKR